MVYLFSGSFFLVSSLLVISLGFSLFALGYTSPLAKTFLLFIVSTLFWNLSYGFYLLIEDKYLALLVYRLGAIGWVMNPSLAFFYAYLMKLEYVGGKKMPQYIWFASLPIPFFLFWAFTGNLMAMDLVPSIDYGWIEVISPTSLPNLLYLVLGLLAIAYFIRTGVILAGSGKTRRAKLHGYLFVIPGIVITSGSLMTNVLFPILGVVGIPPFSQILVGLWIFVTSLVLLRHPILSVSPKIAAETIVNAMSDLCFLVDNSGVILSANPAVQGLLGYQVDTLIGKPIDKVFTGDGAEDPLLHSNRNLLLRFSNDTQANTQTKEVYIPSKNGSLLPCWVMVSPLIDSLGDKVGQVIIAHEVRELKRLQHLAETDKLTGAYNRRPLEQAVREQFESLVHSGRVFSLILADLDHFKAVNDSLGHEAGDMVLQEFAGIVSQSIRSEDMFVRWGGEEFIILCPGSNLEAAGILAERIRHQLHRHIFPQGKRITCSFGVVEAKTHDTQSTLISRADQALYKAKELGRNRVVQEHQLRA
jgi:diguanylate cyclase (GGDEF)-like protein/PAS domain S-box-containing protein